MTQHSPGAPGAQRGPFAAGDQVQLTDPKGRMHQIVLQPGGTFHTHRGSLRHDDLIGAPEGSVVTATSGTAYVALRPLLADFTLAMKRGATIVYPKDAAQIVAYADIFPGARVLEAGAGSGALSCWLLRALGPAGQLVSFEARADFADIARANVARFFGGLPPQWRLLTEKMSAAAAGEPGTFDRVILDMLAPWECVPDAASALIGGGLICCYVATVTQLARVVEELRGHGGFFEPAAWETLVRGWHVDGLAVRPDHRMIGHTGFLVTARRLAVGVTAPPRRRRPAKGAHPEGAHPEGAHPEGAHPEGAHPQEDPAAGDGAHRTTLQDEILTLPLGLRSYPADTLRKPADVINWLPAGRFGDGRQIGRV